MTTDINKNLKSKAVKGVAWSLIDKLFTQAVSFVVVILLARELSPADFGLVGMLAIFLAISETLVNSGFSSALIQKKDRSEKDYSTVFLLNLSVSLLIYLILFFCAPFIANFYDVPELVELSRVLFIVLIINSLSIVPNTKLTIDLNFKLKSKINIISLIFSSFLALYLAINGFGVWSIVAQNITRSLVASILLLFFSSWKPRFYFSVKSFRRLFGFGSNLMLAGVISAIVNNLYGLLIGRYFTAQHVGYYMQGQRITTIMAGTISSVLQGVTYPIMTSVQDDKERLISIYKRVITMTAFISFPCMVGLTMIAEPFVIVFLTEKWLPAVPVIQWLCLASMFIPISALNLNMLNATGRSDLFLKVDLIKLPINLVALIVTVPYGIEAVVIGQLFTRIIAFLMNAYFPGKLFGYGAFQQLRDFKTIIISTSFMALTLSFVKTNNVTVELVVKLLLGILVFLLVNFLLKTKSQTELLEIVKEKMTGGTFPR
ncbi:lipopolysaccharide biosynthesis protein [Thalassotalea sp. Y01]|uniref:lipopolysaccharide biosynthesis protein n=1 Tax=Thalassotalea sp. Y01 TaxID=2729613 RepID=UPI00145FC9E8|nr:lipopolysaccharide biosynthesis protein [Thalassotalea sp. Y01]NMP16501.1 lipopolysaccharide biosynthesis protein [Thalassotalea sp. Y01]